MLLKPSHFGDSAALLFPGNCAFKGVFQAAPSVFFLGRSAVEGLGRCQVGRKGALLLLLESFGLNRPDVLPNFAMQ